MDIQIDNGEFTRLHNTILEKLAMARLTGSEYRCLMFLFRMTYGWQKKEDAISLSQWAIGIGLEKHDRGNVHQVLQGLVTKRVIYVNPNGSNRPATYGFNKNWEQWEASLFIPTVMPEHNSRDAGVMPQDNSSVMSQHNTTVMPEHSATVMSQHNHKRKKEILKKVKEKGERAPARIASPREPASKEIRFKSPHVDLRHFVNGYVPPGKGTNAVEVYYERFSIHQDVARLNAIKEDDLATFCKDLDKLRGVVTAYSRTAFQLGNVQLILDWYKDGIPEKHRPPSTNGVYKNNNSTDEERTRKQARARQAREKIKTAELTRMPIDPQWLKDIEAAT